MTNTTEMRIAGASLARSRLLKFAQRLMPGYDTPPHIRLIASLLEEVESGKRRRLAIAVPVRHGKSVLASQAFAAYFVGRNPTKNVILASHSEELAVRNSRVAKNLVADSRWPFLDVELAADSSAAGRWNVKQGGGCYAIGVGGAITGRGADALIIDDALHDGLSENEMISAFRWYSEVAIPRLEPGGAVILIGARFDSQDLLGQVLASEDGPNWVGNIVNLPAIAEEGDPLGRQPGEALWPERYSLEEIEQRRVAMAPRAFEAQFQQRPVPLEGGLFKRAWFEHRYDFSDGTWPTVRIREPVGAITSVTPDGEYVYEAYSTREGELWTALSLDASSKDGSMNDWSVFAILAHDGVDFYVMDIVRERLQFHGLVSRFRTVYDKWQPMWPFVEDTANGTPLIQELRRATSIPVIAVKPLGSKVARAGSVEAFFAAGKVKFPKHAPWLEQLIDEFCAFPNGRHDDVVDAVVHGIMRLDELARSYYESTRYAQIGDLLAR